MKQKALKFAHMNCEKEDQVPVLFVMEVAYYYGKEKAYLHSVFPDEKIATNFFKTIQGNLKQVKEFIKIEISEGEVVFNQNSLSQD